MPISYLQEVIYYISMFCNKKSTIYKGLLGIKYTISISCDEEGITYSVNHNNILEEKHRFVSIDEIDLVKKNCKVFCKEETLSEKYQHFRIANSMGRWRRRLREEDLKTISINLFTYYFFEELIQQPVNKYISSHEEFVVNNTIISRNGIGENVDDFIFQQFSISDIENCTKNSIRVKYEDIDNEVLEKYHLEEK